MKDLSILLEGSEEATYQRGTDTTTDREVFFSRTLFHSVDPSEFRSGRVEISIPSDSMSSFEGKNNKIVWKIKVAGDIPNWPDLKEEFLLNIVPIPTDGVRNRG